MDYLKTTYFFDFKNIHIQRIIAPLNSSMPTKKEQAKKLYLIIRDGWRYNPYMISISKEKYIASHIAQKKDGHCIDKSILLIACLRALGIPARLHLAKVKNHIAVERLTEKFGTNELTPHGMVDLFINGKWLKVSPAFNAELCEKCNVDPLDFDGEQDSIFQEYNRSGSEFMEYLEDYGHFDDLPFEFIIENFKSHYPQYFDSSNGQTDFEF